MSAGWRLAIGLVLVLAAPGAVAQPLGAGAPVVAADPVARAGSGASSHAWVVVPTSKGDARVLHLPPRRSPDAVDGLARGAPDGSARVAGQLGEMPAMIAAWGDRLYLLEDRPERFPSTPRRVSSLRAVRTGVGDLWGTEPRDSLDAHANLPGAGRLAGFTACALGPAALVDVGGVSGVDSLRAFLLVDGRWMELSTPRTEGASARRFWQGTGRGLELVVVRASGEVGAWMLPVDKALATLLRQSTDESAAVGADARAPIRVDVEWTPMDPGVWPGVEPSRVAALREVAGQRIALTSEGSGQYTLRQRAGGEWRSVGGVSDAGEGVALAPLEGVGRVALLWTGAGSGTTEIERWEIAEVSAFTGAMIYRGPVRLAAPISMTDVRWLLLALVAVMSLVVVFLLRAESRSDVVAIPEGMAMAELGRRGVAVLIDYAAGVLVGAMAMGLSVREALTIDGLLHGQGVCLLVAGLGVAGVVGTFMEWGTGRTLGKMLVGCEVLDASAGASGGPATNEGRPTFARALLRNVLKYALPPAGLTAFLDMNGRHVGDRLARTVVVIHAPPDETSEG